MKLDILTLDNRFDIVLNYILSGHSELAYMAVITLVRKARRKEWLRQYR